MKVQELKQDVSKLLSLTKYAKVKGISRQTVYNKIKAKELEPIFIDGKPFLKP